MDSMYLENLDEFIKDESRIVTYKWLSLSLGVHVNVAKQMLFHYLSQQRKADSDDGLTVTYMVSGIVAGKDKEPDMHKVVLVREENLPGIKSKMDIVSMHIYSIQKTKLKDISVLYTANYDKVKDNIASINRYSGIACPSAIVKSSADLEKLNQRNAYQAPAEPAPLQKKAKPPQEKAQPKKEPDSEENVVKPAISSKQTGKGNQIASMFARQNTKADDKKEEKKVEKQQVSKTTSTVSKKTSGISAFFSKEPASKKPETPKSSPIKSEPKVSPSSTESSKYPSTESENTSSPLMTESLLSSVKTESQDSTLTQDSPTDSVEVNNKSPSKKAKAKTQTKIKPKKASQKSGKSKRKADESPIPKRKRIMQLSDSDSSSEEEDEGEDESPYPASPEPEPTRIESDEEIPSTPQLEPKGEQLSRNGRSRKRKLVAKTFEDEDGFLITKKEYEYVSDSGEEEQEAAAVKSDVETTPDKKNNNSPKKPISKSPQKKAAAKSPQKKAAVKSPKKKHSQDATKTKQSSIMSFFGKK